MAHLSCCLLDNFNANSRSRIAWLMYFMRHMFCFLHLLTCSRCMSVFLLDFFSCTLVALFYLLCVVEVGKTCYVICHCVFLFSFKFDVEDIRSVEKTGSTLRSICNCTRSFLSELQVHRQLATEPD